MYSFLGRVNSYVYTTMVILAVSGAVNWGSVYFAHHLGLSDHAPGENLKAGDQITFNVKNFDQFILDTYINEEITAFTFDMEANLESLFNWNTNIIFASIECAYGEEVNGFR